MIDVPSTHLAPGARELFHAGGPVGFLFIHGLGGTPHDYESAVTFLSERGYSSLAMRVAGHGGRPKDLAMTHCADWQSSIDLAIEKLRQHAQDIILVGTSFGGALALDALRRHPDLISKLVLVNTPLSYRIGGAFQTIGLYGLRLLMPNFPKPGLLPEEKKRYHYTGSLVAWPISSILESRRFLEQSVRPFLGVMTKPLLLTANAEDPYVAEESFQDIRKNYGGELQTFVIPGKGHRPWRDGTQQHLLLDRILSFVS